MSAHSLSGVTHPLSVQCFPEVAIKGNEHTLMPCKIPVGLGLNPVSMAIAAMMTHLLFQ